MNKAISTLKESAAHLQNAVERLRWERDNLDSKITANEHQLAEINEALTKLEGADDPQAV